MTDFRIGDFVKWDDPAIDDYEPNEREDQLNLVWKILDIDDNEYVNGKYLLVDEFGGECEAFGNELRSIHEHLTYKPNKKE